MKTETTTLHTGEMVPIQPLQSVMPMVNPVSLVDSLNELRGNAGGEFQLKIDETVQETEDMKTTTRSFFLAGTFDPGK